MPTEHKFLFFNKRTLWAAVAAAVCFIVFFFVWISVVRPAAGKSLSTKISDDYGAETLVETGATQTFTYDDDLLAMGFVFGVLGEQPAGALELTLADADTGELLATSTGEMANILPGQYTGMGLNTTVAGQQGRRYAVTLTPHYTGAGRLSLGHSPTATLWEDALTVDGQAVDGTAALLVTYRQIGGFLSRFYWCMAAALTVAVALAVWLALGKKFSLHRSVFVLVLLFGLVYSAVLPPYAAPDEQYHINQSFTMACRWANTFTSEDWRMGRVPLSSSFRRVHDENPLVQDENTTVFTWQEISDNFFVGTEDAFDSHLSREEAQTDANPTLYLVSAAAVFVGYLLRLGFVPVLYLGRTANLLLFALLAAWAIKKAPFGKRIFAAVALLPMSLHLAASFSRDGPLLGLALLFIALCLNAAYSTEPPGPNVLVPLALAGLLLTPAKLVYLPLAALVLLIPAKRLGDKTKALSAKLGYLAACALLALALNGGVLETATTNNTANTAVAPPAAAASEATIAAPQGALLAGNDANTGGTANASMRFTSPNAGTVATAVPLAAAASASAEQAPLDEATTALLNADTADGLVRRMFYYGAGMLNVPESEAAYWVQALQDGDVTAAELGQSFLFAPDASFTDAEQITAASYMFLKRDLMQYDDSLLAMAQSSGFEQAYKAIFSSQEAAGHLSKDITLGSFDETRVPLDRQELVDQVDAARAEREKQSVATGADAICYTPGYMLCHPAATVMLVFNSLVQNTDHYLRTLVGGSLSYYTLELAWGWVIALYLLLGYAMLPSEESERFSMSRRGKALGALVTLASAGLVVLGCITWTPTYYQTIYGLQGRYFLPLLPLGLLLLSPRHIRVQAGSASPLLMGLAAVNAGVLLNAMLAVIAR